MKCKPQIAAEAKERQREGGEQKVPQNSAEVETRDKVAKLAGVSHDTIHKVEVLEKEAPEETKKALREGKTSIHREYQNLRPPKPDTLAAESGRCCTGGWRAVEYPWTSCHAVIR